VASRPAIQLVGSSIDRSGRARLGARKSKGVGRCTCGRKEGRKERKARGGTCPRADAASGSPDTGLPALGTSPSHALESLGARLPYVLVSIERVVRRLTTSSYLRQEASTLALDRLVTACCRGTAPARLSVSWLRRVARAAIHDAQSTARRTTSLSADPIERCASESGPAPRGADSSGSADVGIALLRLGRRDRLACQAWVGLGSIQLAAEACSMSPRNVRRALSNLASRLRESFHDPTE
jgi:hypothetical protein